MNKQSWSEASPKQFTFVTANKIYTYLQIHITFNTHTKQYTYRTYTLQ